MDGTAAVLGEHRGEGVVRNPGGRLRRLAPAPNPASLGPGSPRAVISRSERDVLELLALGLTNRDIASRLHRSPWTVKNQVASMLHKLGLKRRVELALWYEREARGGAGSAPA